MTNSNLEKGIPWRFGPDWPGQRCGAKTRRGTPCQKPALRGRNRCQLHGGKSNGPRTIAFSAVKLTPISASESWFLTGRTSAGLSPAPLAGPIRAKAPWNALLKVAVCHAEISTSYGVLLYPIIGGAASVGWLGLCTLVREN